MNYMAQGHANWEQGHQTAWYAWHFIHSGHKHTHAHLLLLSSKISVFLMFRVNIFKSTWCRAREQRCSSITGFFFRVREVSSYITNLPSCEWSQCVLSALSFHSGGRSQKRLLVSLARGGQVAVHLDHLGIYAPVGFVFIIQESEWVIYLIREA